MNKIPPHLINFIQKHRLHKSYKSIISIGFVLFVFFVSISFHIQQIDGEKKRTVNANAQTASISSQLKTLQKEYEAFKSVDQVKRNDELQENIKNIEKTYKEAASVFEELSDLPSTAKELPDYRKKFAQILKLLSDKNYSSGSAQIASLKTSVEKTRIALLPPVGNGGAPIDPSTLPVNNTAPGSGYSRQRVDAAGESFIVYVQKDGLIRCF